MRRAAVNMYLCVCVCVCGAALRCVALHSMVLVCYSDHTSAYVSVYVCKGCASACFGVSRVPACLWVGVGGAFAYCTCSGTLKDDGATRGSDLVEASACTMARLVRARFCLRCFQVTESKQVLVCGCRTHRKYELIAPGPIQLCSRTTTRRGWGTGSVRRWSQMVGPALWGCKRLITGFQTGSGQMGCSQKGHKSPTFRHSVF